MTLRIPFLILLRAHLIVMAVQSGGLFEFEALAMSTPLDASISEVVSVADPAAEMRDVALFADLSASSPGQNAL